MAMDCMNNKLLAAYETFPFCVYVIHEDQNGRYGECFNLNAPLVGKNRSCTTDLAFKCYFVSSDQISCSVPIEECTLAV